MSLLCLNPKSQSKFKILLSKSLKSHNLSTYNKKRLHKKSLLNWTGKMAKKIMQLNKIYRKMKLRKNPNKSLSQPFFKTNTSGTFSSG